MDPAELEEISAALEHDAALREVCLRSSSGQFDGQVDPTGAEIARSEQRTREEDAYDDGNSQ